MRRRDKVTALAILSAVVFLVLVAHGLGRVWGRLTGLALRRRMRRIAHG